MFNVYIHLYIYTYLIILNNKNLSRDISKGVKFSPKTCIHVLEKIEVTFTINLCDTRCREFYKR